ncbi:MAG: hypothetical protein AAGA85_07400, partial [Bacteroidota bacterium]
MRTEKKLLNKEALRTIKGGFAFAFPTSISTFGGDPGGEPEDGGFTDANSEEDDVVNVGGNPT